MDPEDRVRRQAAASFGTLLPPQTRRWASGDLPEKPAGSGKVDRECDHLPGFEIGNRDNHKIAAKGLPQNLCNGAQQRPKFKVGSYVFSNLIATNQVNTGDWIEADFDRMSNCLLFTTRTDGRAPKAVSRTIAEQSRISTAAA